MRAESYQRNFALTVALTKLIIIYANYFFVFFHFFILLNNQ